MKGDLLGDLSLEERETVVETLRRAMPMLSRRELESLTLKLLGLSGSLAGEVLGVSKQAVNRYTARAYAKVRRVAKSWLSNAPLVGIRE